MAHSASRADVGSLAPDYLEVLESHAVFVMREVAAECHNPALLFSGGKDSAVLLRLAEKAFRPGAILFPLLHVDTGHNFPETLEFRDLRVSQLRADLRVALVQDSIDRGLVEDPGPGQSRNRIQSVSLTEAISRHGFDACIGGAAETRTRRGPRSASSRCAMRGGVGSPTGNDRSCGISTTGRWVLVNTSASFPCPTGRRWMSGATSAGKGWLFLPSTTPIKRQVIEREGMLLAVSEWVTPTLPEVAHWLSVRYRTVGDATLTGAVRSNALTADEVIAEIADSRVSERGATRGDDEFSESSMEDRKREGYF